MIRRTALALALGALLVTACSDKRSAKRRPPAAAAAPVTAVPRSDPPLARWLRRVPADARWAVVSVDLDRLRAVASDVAALVGHHPDLAPALRHWRARLVRQWGGWPLAPDFWARLGLRRGSGGALYRRADGVTVVLFRTDRLGRVLETINQAIRKRGARRVADVERLRVAGRPAYQIDGWTCATRGGVSACADVPPARFAQVIRPGTDTLWPKVPGGYAGGRHGIWIGPRASFGRGLHRAARDLVGWAPRGLWLAASLGRRLQVRGLVLSPSAARGATSSPAAGPPLPKPGQSGLAAAGAAPLVIRLRMSPRRLGDHVHRLVPALRPALDLIRRQPVSDSLAEEMLNGEVVLLADHAGVAAICGLRSRSGGLRAMKRLILLLSPRIGGWQKRVRGRGRGWDLSYANANLGDVSTHRLILRVPPGAGSGAPRLRNGRLTLLWGMAQRHLVVATDANLFRRILARVDQTDADFLRQLGDAAGRRGFRDHRAVAALVRPDDPLFALPKAQRDAARRWIDDLGPTSRRSANGVRALMDLIDSATLSCEDLPAGIGCHLGISLVTKSAQTKPGSHKKSGTRPSLEVGLEIDGRYREALIKKWGGNFVGHLRLVQALATAPTASPLRAKASRALAHRRGAPSCSLEGLLVSLWLPWARHRLVITARQEAPRELDRLARALQDLAKRAQNLPAAARRRWYRPLRSTRITPTRSCCKGGVRRCESKATDWIHPTWRRLGFGLSGPHLYRYQVTRETGSLRQRIVLRALGDLDCNGRSSLLQRVGTIDTATGALQVGPLIRVRADD